MPAGYGHDMDIRMLQMFSPSIYKPLEIILKMRLKKVSLSQGVKLVIANNLLKVLSDFLSNRKQRVVLNNQFSKWAMWKLGFVKAQFLERYYLWYILMTYMTTYRQILSYSRMISHSFTAVTSLGHCGIHLNNDLRKISE